MKRSTKIALVLGTALTLGSGIALVHAQPGPGYGMGWGMGYGMGPGMHGYGYGMGPRFNEGPGATADRLAILKSDLAITAKQESAWQAFVTSAQKRAETRQAWFAKLREARPAASAPEALAQRTEYMKQRQSDLESTATALKDLYAVLTPEQRAIADSSLGGPGCATGDGPSHRGGRGWNFR